MAGARGVGRLLPGLHRRRPRPEVPRQRRGHRADRGRPADHRHPRRLRLHVPRVPVPTGALLRVHGHADAAHRGHPDPERADHPVARLAQLLPGARRAVPRHRLRHVPAPPGLPGHPTRPARRLAARRLRPPGVPAPRRHPRHPAGGRLVRGHLLPRRLEPVHLAPGRGHRGPLGDHPDRPAQRRPPRAAEQNNVGFAAALLAALPIVLLLVFLQRQLVRGLTTGAVKG